MLGNIPLDYYVLAGALNFLTSAALAVAVFFKDPKSRTNLTFSFFAFTVAGWALCYFLWLRTNVAQTAEFYLRTLMLFVVFIPTTFTHFTLALLKADAVLTKGINLLNYSASTLLGVASYTRYFASDIGPFLIFPYWLRPGILFGFHTAHFFANVLYAHFLMLQAVRQSSGISRNQILYVFIGTAIGYVGGAINYLTWYRVPIPPFLNPLVSVYVATVSYAIVKYRLMDINLALTRTAVFTGVYALVLGVPLLAALVWQPRLEGALGSRWWVWLLIAYAVLATVAHYANLHFQRRAESRILAEERRAHEALQQISQNMMRFTRLKALLGSSVKYVVRILQVNHAAIYLLNEDKGVYERKGVWHSPPRKDSPLPAALPADSSLVTDLSEARLPRVREELKLQQQGISSLWKELMLDLGCLHASVVIPAFRQGRLFGFVALGEKRSGRIWSQDDLNVLMVLANQCALAVENAQLHEAEEARLIKEAIEQTAADIAYGVSHQFNNRLYVISILSSSQVLSLANKDLSKLSNEELAGLVRKLAGELKKISDEAEMGGQISKGIMSLARAIPENFKPIEVPAVIGQAIDFVRIKHSKEKVEGEDLAPAILNGVPKDLPKVLGNHAQIHDSLMNLLDNALDAIREKIYRSHRGELQATGQDYKGKIQVKAGVQKGKVIVSVEDDGIGIEKEDMHRIFAPYFTTKATGIKGRGLGGHGLGLYFIKRIMEAHGGRVYAQSEHLKWTRFTVELPIPREEDLKNADTA